MVGTKARFERHAERPENAGKVYGKVSPKCRRCGKTMSLIESSSDEGEFSWWECPVDGISEEDER